MINSQLSAQTRLPQCPGTIEKNKWNNCFGIIVSTTEPNLRYEGEFQNSKPHGTGIFYGLNSRFLGEFRDGKPTRGTKYSADGRVVSGQYRNGEFVKDTPDSEASNVASAQKQDSPKRVQMIQSGSTYKVPARLNDQITLDFTLDSGASDVLVPADVVLTLIRTNTITDSDFKGNQTYRLADGSIVKSRKFILRMITVGNLTVHNVTAAINDVEGSLLLGQSFLRKFSSWTIDNKNNELILTNYKDDNNETATPDRPVKLLERNEIEQKTKAGTSHLHTTINQPKKTQIPQPLFFSEIRSIPPSIFRSSLNPLFISDLDFSVINSSALTFIKPTIKAKFYTPNGSYIGELCNRGQLSNMAPRLSVERKFSDQLLNNPRAAGLLDGYKFGRCDKEGNFMSWSPVWTSEEKFIADSDHSSMKIKIFLFEAMTSNREKIVCDENFCQLTAN